MTGLLQRFGVGLLAMFAGGLVALLLRGEGKALLGALIGGVLGFAAIVVFDAMRGSRLLGWLSGAQDTPAPRDAGFWGAIGYRIERRLRGLARTAEAERLRLSQFVAALEASPNCGLLLDAGDQI